MKHWSSTESAISALKADIDMLEPFDSRAQSSARLTLALLDRIGRQAFQRSPVEDHITGSGFVLSPDRTKVLLMLHRKLGRWLQPGGHCDGDTDVRAVAMREVGEELGTLGARLASARIFDIDVHEIPTHGAEPAHLHHDIRFLFEIDPRIPVPGNSESRELRWINLSDLEDITRKPSVLVARHAHHW